MESWGEGRNERVLLCGHDCMSEGRTVQERSGVPSPLSGQGENEFPERDRDPSDCLPTLHVAETDPSFAQTEADPGAGAGLSSLSRQKPERWGPSRALAPARLSGRKLTL